MQSRLALPQFPQVYCVQLRAPSGVAARVQSVRKLVLQNISALQNETAKSADSEELLEAQTRARSILNESVNVALSLSEDKSNILKEGQLDLLNSARRCYEAKPAELRSAVQYFCPTLHCGALCHYLAPGSDFSCGSD